MSLKGLAARRKLGFFLIFESNHLCIRLRELAAQLNDTPLPLPSQSLPLPVVTAPPRGQIPNPVPVPPTSIALDANTPSLPPLPAPSQSLPLPVAPAVPRGQIPNPVPSTSIAPPLPDVSNILYLGPVSWAADKLALQVKNVFQQLHCENLAKSNFVTKLEAGYLGYVRIDFKDLKDGPRIFKNMLLYGHSTPPAWQNHDVRAYVGTMPQI